ncbi:MAG: carbohydrate binding family 9 domain-containing protein, partial [Candidatus Aminicenantes bacterium]
MKLYYVNFSIIIFAALFNAPGFQLKAEEYQKNRQLPPARHYHVNPATSSIKIDGALNEEGWQEAVLIELPYEWFPGDNIPAPVKTECMVTYSKSKLFIGFRCFDPDPKKIRAHLINRDAINTYVLDDHVVIQLDCFNDDRRSFQFRVNPLGVQADAMFSTFEGYEDFSWDAIWDSAGKITDFGYAVEIAIPFNQLRFPKTSGKQKWGFNAERSYPRNVRHRMCSHIRSRDERCLLCQFNKITGFEGISPGRNLELDPTLTLNRTDKRNDFPKGEMENGKIKVEPGVTFKWGITPNLILNATLNPDFSNVEADAAQLEVNTRFALRYPEKRPFFLEAADLFLTPMEVVFTRTVFDPLWGVKTSGKIGKNALGIFATQDRYNNLIFPSNKGSSSTTIKENVYGGVLRYRRDIGKNTTVGVLYTGRFSENYHNQVAGVDSFIRLSGIKKLNIQFLHSQTLYPGDISQQFNQPTDSFGGNALFIRFENMGRHLFYFFNYEDLSAGFRADFGFIPRVDTRRLGAGIGPILWGKQGQWFNRINIELRGEKITNHA